MLNNINESNFHRLADRALSAMFDILEQADAAGMLEVDHQPGVITLTLPDERQFIINKHAPTQQLWLSSPISGGLHFSFNADSGEWALPDGRILGDVLAGELQSAGIEVTF